MDIVDNVLNGEVIKGCELPDEIVSSSEEAQPPLPTDTTPPETTITSGPSGSVSGTAATFELTSSEPGSTFQRRLHPLESAPTSCTSPKAYSGLAAGTEYTFSVWATDASGNTDGSPATLTFTPSGDAGTTDTDGDDVLGAYDLCPSQPGPASNNGCPLESALSAVLVGAGDLHSPGPDGVGELAHWGCVYRYLESSVESTHN